MAIKTLGRPRQVDGQRRRGDDLLGREFPVEIYVCHADDYPSFIVDGQIELWHNLPILTTWMGTSKAESLSANLEMV